MKTMYIAHSTQKDNVGVGNYGTEQDTMIRLVSRTIYWVTTQKGIRCRTNKKGWTLDQTINDCNHANADLFVDNHSDAGPSKAQGTTVFYNGKLGVNSKSYKLAKKIYENIAPLSPGKDRGIKPDTSLYASGLAAIQKTNCPAALVEHIFHTNAAEVKDLLATIDEYAKGEAKSLLSFLGIKWIEPTKKATYKVGIVTADGLNVRAEATVKSKIVKILNKGDRVRTYGLKNGFYDVNIGWVSNIYIKLEGKK